jgi:hypothetical protein
MKIKFLMLVVFALMLSCEEGSNNLSSSDSSGSEGIRSNGQGGSTARFAITRSHLYVVNHNHLATYDIDNLANPQKTAQNDIGFDLETIFPKGNHLFIGSMNGMFIMNIDNPSNPEYVSQYQHVVACDPVVANDEYAYVTLRSTSFGRCTNNINELHIISLENLNDPQLVKTVQMVNPKGLGILGDKLFVCDDVLKMYDISDMENPIFEKSFDIKANDIIPFNDLLIVTADDGIYQYRFANNETQFLSKIGASS